METDKYSNFEKYLTGDMSSEEHSTFEKNLEADSEFKQDFIIYQRIEREMNAFYGASAEEDKLRNSLETISREFVLSKVDKKPKQVYLLPFLKGIAAAFLLLSGVYLLYVTASKDLSEEVSNYYAANYATLSQTMGSAEEGIQQGIAAYNQGEYEMAAGIFSGILDDEPDNSGALKNLGLSFLAMEDYDSALHAFEQYGSIPDLFVNDGLIMQAMTLLMRGEGEDLEKAKNLLKEVVSGNHPGKVQAEVWLKKFK